MPKEAIQPDSENGPLDLLEVERLKDRVLELSNRSGALAKGYHGPIEDVALAQEIARGGQTLYRPPRRPEPPAKCQRSPGR